MRLTKFLWIGILILFCGKTHSQEKYEWKQANAAGYSYKYVTNDPMQTRFYTLKNGLTVIFTVNHKEPRVSARIAVRAGSDNDPDDHTGLAHYLEHLLFKGTDRFGSLDWSKERPCLDTINGLYERYNSTKDTLKRKAIYKEIDRVSVEASHYSIANEYTNMMTAIGSQGTNAHTYVEETIYEEDIPVNAMDKFLAIQAERFRYPVFRLFHTELEAVYEEKNAGLDDDSRKMSEVMHSALFPTHNYGRHTTIGTIEHLKNPSLKAIRDFYNNYYVPDDMAIIMAGDIDPDSLIKKIDRSFAYMSPRPVKPYTPAAEKPITSPMVKEVYGPSAENMQISFRMPAANTHDALVLDLISGIFSNGKAGMLDLDLNKQQKIQSSQAWLWQYKDYGILTLTGNPKKGQTLGQVKDLLMAEIAKLKKGDFDKDLIAAIVANSKLSLLQGLESNGARVGALQDEFIKSKGEKWNKNVASLDDQAKLTREELLAVANKYLANNYLVLYKRKGEDKSIVKVPKPPITPVETNTGKESDFVKRIAEMPVLPVQPLWLDFKKDITRSSMGMADVLYTQNKENDLFRLYYRLDIGSRNNKFQSLAASYLQFLSTDKYTAEQISKAFYKLACSFSISTTADNTTITLTGLQENFGKATALFEEIIHNCKPDGAALAALKDRLMKARANNKLNKSAILQGLIMYARYGEKNPYNTTLSDTEISSLKPADLVEILHTLLDHKHTIIYYGPQPVDAMVSTLSGIHILPASFTPDAIRTEFAFTTQTSNQVLFADYDMVQAEICWIRNSAPYDPSREPLVDIFDNYFGGGMSSVVFRTIRESKALAYTTYATYGTPEKKQDPFYILAYIGCQADKLNDVLTSMNELMNDLPVSQESFELARASLRKDLETERITQDGIIFSWLAEQKKGLDYDQRKEEYTAIENITMDQLKKFHEDQFSGKAYTYCVVASAKKINMDDLKKVGPVKTLTLEQVFGY